MKVMKIVNIVPGFGGTFYCGNCLRDSAYAQSLRAIGHDAVILPVYLPLTMSNRNDGPEIPVFYGAVSIYLRQQFPLMRHMPGWMENLFNSKPMLALAAKKSGSTRAHGLEKLTESMLLGQDGNQRHELKDLAAFLKDHLQPDIVHFSNALLLGMAKQIREEVRVPVVCSLQDEDVWVDVMDETWRNRIWDLMAEKGRYVDAFIAVSSWFSGIMQEKMRIVPGKMHTVPIGVKPGNYVYSGPSLHPMTIGYLSRICEENGFGILADAFILLKADPAFRGMKLKVTGGMTGDDKPFLHQQIKKFRDHGVLDDVEFREDFSLDGLRDFFRSLTVMSVPVLKGEAFGLYQLEALASGIPIIQPALGAFPEIVEATGGGGLYSPNSAEALAVALKEVLADPERLKQMSISGRKAVEEKFDSDKLAERMAEIYEQIR